MDKISTRTKLSVILLLSFGFTDGFQTGAPDLACTTMTPQHGPPPQPGNSPFRIMVSNPKSTGNPIDIKIVAPSQGPNFMGFLIQVRQVGGNQPVGQFNPSSDPTLAQSVSCNGEANAAMTHKNNNEKSQVSLQWTPPPGNGQYEVLVTVVQKKDTFWVKQMAADKIEVTATDARAGSGQQPNSSSPVAAPNNNSTNSGGNTGSSSQQPPSEGGSATNTPLWSSIFLSMALLL